MKKIIFAITSVLLLGFSATNLAIAAGGGGQPVRLTPLSATAPADNSSTITVSVFIYDNWYRCPNGQLSATNQWCIDNAGGSGTLEEIGFPCGANVTSTGIGNTITPSHVIADSSGNGSFTIKSSVAEAKTITVTYDGSSCGAGFGTSSTSVTFTTPPAVTPTTTPKKSTTSTSAPTAPAPASPNPPAIPSASTVTIAGATADTTKPITLASNKPLILSGKTVANGVVTLTIHSTPKTAIVTADKDGNWTYSVTGLDPGSHYVEASVMDPATKQTSSTAKLLSFSVTAAKAIPAVATVSKKASHTAPYAIIVILVALVDGGYYGWVSWNKKRHNHNLNPPQNPQVPTIS